MKMAQFGRAWQKRHSCCLKTAVVKVYRIGFNAELTGKTKTANQAYREGDMETPKIRTIKKLF